MSSSLCDSASASLGEGNGVTLRIAAYLPVDRLVEFLS
jgi:hypothetical protein